MADSPPLSTTAPETVTVDTGADPQSVASLNKSFSDFWAEQDNAGAAGSNGSSTTSQEPPPAAPAAAPATGAAQETKKPVETPLETKPPPSETKPTKSETVPPPTAREVTDDEIDRMQPSPNARPDHQTDFKTIKDLWKADRAKLKTEAERATRLESELTQARQSGLTPEQKADYENASALRRQFNFATDPTFINQYQLPIRNQFHKLLDEAVEALPDKSAAKAWADHIKTNYQPEQLNRTWWLNSVIAKVPSEIERQALMGEMSNLLKLQRERDGQIAEHTKDENSFQSWMQNRINAQAEQTRNDIMAEIGVQEKRIQEVLPRDINQAKTTEEREAITKHNERFSRLNDYFKGVIQDLASNGPRAWVRAGVEATRTQMLLEENESLTKELKDIKAEHDRVKAELDKITGVRRKLAATTGTPPASAPAANRAAGQGLSIKQLDVRDAFKSYDWGDGNT